jgi:hypothetical protein
MTGVHITLDMILKAAKSPLRLSLSPYPREKT